MRHIATLAALGVTCAGCSIGGPPPAEVTYVNIRVAPDDPNCRVYTAVAQVDYRQENLFGHACALPGGGWQVTEGTNTNPRRFQQIVSAQTAANFPWRNEPPVGISTGRLVINFPFDQPPNDADKWHR